MEEVFKDEYFLLPTRAHEAYENTPLLSSDRNVNILAEVEFLSRFWKGENAYLVYVASNLSSLPFLAKLFPSIKFHAYSSKAESSTNLIYHKEEFSYDLAKGWRNTRLLYPVYFICYEDPEKQKLWHLTIKPSSSFLCLDCKKEKYLSGYLFVQPNNLDQVMLMPEEKEKKYGQSLLQRMAYYQRVTRKKKFNMEGEILSFDQAYEVQVLRDYLNKTRGKSANLEEVRLLREELGY
jgi:hypothetical protein